METLNRRLENQVHIFVHDKIANNALCPIEEKIWDELRGKQWSLSREQVFNKIRMQVSSETQEIRRPLRFTLSKKV